MIVCLCEGLSERDIRATIKAGAASVSELERSCKAGGDCGRCRPALRLMLRDGSGAGQASPAQALR